MASEAMRSLSCIPLGKESYPRAQPNTSMMVIGNPNPELTGKALDRSGSPMFDYMIDILFAIGCVQN